MRDVEQQVVFCAAKGAYDQDVVILGIPKGAWDYMKNGHTHTFDLTKVGIKLQIVLFGGADHSACMKLIESAASVSGTALDDQRREDFTMKGERYFLKPDGGVELEVTKDQFIRTERASGFRPKLPSTDPTCMTTCATGGFHGNGWSGRVEYPK